MEEAVDLNIQEEIPSGPEAVCMVLEGLQLGNATL